MTSILLRLLFLLPLFWAFASCKPLDQRHFHNLPLSASETPPAPDYKQESNWAALPDRYDCADALPHDTLTDRQATSPADVFFVYPTLFLEEPEGPNKWNADVQDKDLNEKITSQSIKNQASVFNGAGRVFSPLYRQAHISAYYTPDSLKAKAAFDTAYADVKRAFLHYLEHNNQGRPFILAGHSQGTTHARRLLQELIQDTELQDRLIAAYLVGMPVRPSDFTSIRACETAEETGCYLSWRSWLWGHTPYPEQLPEDYEYATSTNPLLWTTDTTYAPRKLNKGGVLRSFKLVPEVADAKNHRGILWLHKPHFFGSFLFNLKNWHVADYNLFYLNIRQNAWQRVQAWQQLNATP